MLSSVINGAIGKSPVIDRINQQAVKDMDYRTTEQLEQYICQSDSVPYLSSLVSFPECRKKARRYLTECRKGKGNENGYF